MGEQCSTQADNANVERQGEPYVYVAKVDFEGAFGPIKGPSSAKQVIMSFSLKNMSRCCGDRRTL